MAVSSNSAEARVLGEPWALRVAAIGVLLAVGLVVLVGVAAERLWIGDSRVALLVSYLAVWVPLGGAVVVVGVGAWRRLGAELGVRPGAGSFAGSFVRGLGLRFQPLDLLWGLAVGLLARVAASLIEIAGYGQMGGSPVLLGTPVYDGWWLFGALLAPVLIAPFVEEVFFRGLLLRGVAGSTDARPVALSLAVVVSAAVFALLHVLDAESATVVVVAGLSTFVFGLAAGSVAAATGRLGGAVIAHVTFNALVVVPAVLGALG
ncbi:CPBP family intramembrane metalloprotease [Cryobacterium algoritolerans]|uniref:CPBP family intramembrane metalloprotease n=1 Tax=Cryobacterium algoritolerans TaxID=1259184 RepID=A0A4R8WKK1_9MICO|nr:CPBP family glutamic-type intramembrane protease [Cryobacterium algoritolerans]TFC12016.1 CPBP family intramembrane metalloprotease [Cryobacterium algoritolerans]